MSRDVETVLAALKENNFKPVEYAEKAEDAVQLILDLIPLDATFEMAGSMSVAQLGIMDQHIKRGGKGPEPSNPMDVIRTRKDILLVSTNAVTLDGKLVNTDGMGNRVTGMVYGPKQVILLVGANKIVSDLDEAFDRVQNVIAPYHARTMGLATPCAKTGKCEDCNSPQRICNVTTIINKKPPGVDFAIILCGEDLGLGWDPDWPEERIEKIASTYREEITKIMASFPPPRGG